MTKIVVNGANGFIGARLLQLAAREGWQGVGLGRTSPVYAVDKGISWTIWDQVTHAPAALKETDRADVLVQCAVSKAKELQLDDISANFSANTLGVVNLVQLCKLNQIQKIVFLGTANAYQIEPGKAAAETTALFPTGPDVGYLSSLIAAEMLLKTICEQEGIDLLVLRLSSVYGFSPSGKGLIAQMHHKALTKTPIELFNTQNFKADYLWVDDIFQVISSGLKCTGSHAFNLASGEHKSLADLIEILQTQLRHFNPIWMDKGNTGSNRVFPSIDNSKVKEQLGYVPTSLDVGVTKSVEACSGMTFL